MRTINYEFDDGWQLVSGSDPENNNALHRLTSLAHTHGSTNINNFDWNF